MFAVRVHGRGGQGVVTAAELLSVAAFLEGRHAQAFPSFGSERTGAPVEAYCRIDDRPIRAHEPVLDADALIVQDASLFGSVDVLAGLVPGGLVLVNSARTAAELGLAALPGVLTVPATDLARRLVGRPVPNVPLLGAFAAATGLVSLDAVTAAVRQRFSGPVADGNVAAAVAAHALLRERSMKERTDAHAG